MSYTALYNLLTFPAGVVPVSTVTAGDEEELGRYEGHHQDHWDKLLKQVRDVRQLEVSGGNWCSTLVRSRNAIMQDTFFFLEAVISLRLTAVLL